MKLIEFEPIEALCSELKEKYPEGLWLDMDDKEARKFAKDQAKNVNDIIKSISRVRIDNIKAYKADIDAKANELIHRISESAKPLLDIVDEHKKARQSELDTEKEKKSSDQAELEEYRAQKTRKAKFDQLFNSLMDLTGDIEVTEKLIKALKDDQIKHVLLEIK